MIIGRLFLLDRLGLLFLFFVHFPSYLDDVFP